MCKVERIRNEMLDPVRGILDALLRQPLVSGTAIARALTEQGYPVGTTVVRAHRRGACACGGSTILGHAN